MVIESQILAGAPQIVNPVKEGVSKLTQYIIGNSALKLLLVIIGAAAIVVCALLLVLRKFWPTTPIGQALQGNGTIGWCCAGLLVGLMLILPDQILPFVAGALATLFQVVLDIFAAVMNL
ncbi:hypothetical protein [Bifidobacterium myosotis]|uniref:Uncharacterized protein n=1 Tax=Bifidobacterium myosotis TaxID=1630166 RepID=A0A5M9ZH45_9BIFI|nr:hypothetical protein [Bifidobacterium myosotis]KAA8826914.1 hypothetical protein EMO91_10300 [Bifidobacterium myosotis]